MQKRPAKWLSCLALLVVTGSANASKVEDAPTLSEARRILKSKIVPSGMRRTTPLAQPPVEIFTTIQYPSQVGNLAAYLTPDPKDGKKYPAIIWITGGDCNSIGEVWGRQSIENDQSASAYRKRGIVMMFPSLRGGNENPGTREGLLGEVDDVLAAAKYLEKLAYVDKNQIYLGGHSTGGTLALLVSECSSRFKAVFSFGPVFNVAHYGSNSQFARFDLGDNDEVLVRAPGYWLGSIKTPTWILEGVDPSSNIDDLIDMKEINTNPNVHLVPIRGANHFTCLGPTNELLAEKIKSGGKISLTPREAELNLRKPR